MGPLFAPALFSNRRSASVVSGLVTRRPSEEDGQWCGGSRFSAELLGSFLKKDPELFNTDWVIAVLHADGVHDWQYRLRQDVVTSDIIGLVLILGQAKAPW